MSEDNNSQEAKERSELIDELKNSFPSMLRKMWSAGEILEWLENQKYVK